MKYLKYQAKPIVLFPLQYFSTRGPTKLFQLLQIRQLFKIRMNANESQDINSIRTTLDYKVPALLPYFRADETDPLYSFLFLLDNICRTGRLNLFVSLDTFRYWAYSPSPPLLNQH